MPTDIVASATHRRPSTFRLQGWHVLAILLGFFGVVGGVNAVMLRMALTTMPGLDARNGYDESQRYNRRITDAEAMDARGLKVSAELGRAGTGAELQIGVQARDGAPLAGAHVSARLEHPAIRSRDLTLELIEYAPGRYAARVDDIAAGGWTMVILVREKVDGAPVFLSRNRITLGRA
jgi:nitrogen fixation protein FixH